MTRYDPGYRISHGQKSLSLVLKHMWCHDYLLTLPPVCVIDSIVLGLAAAHRAKHPVPWTYVNSIDTYREHLDYVAEACGGHPAAVWELFAYKGSNPPRIVGEESLHDRKATFLDGDKWAAKKGAERKAALQGALNDVHHSAFSHHPLYNSIASGTDKKSFHHEHDGTLTAMYEGYESGAKSTQRDVEEDVLELRRSMNESFSYLFQ